MTKYIVANNTTYTKLVYFDKVKARIAVDYLSFTTSHFWYLKIVAD